MKRFLTAAMLLLITSSPFAQSERQGVLIDEFGKTSCEDLLARTDNFSNQLQANAGATGTVVVFGDARTARNPLEFVHRAIIGRWGLKIPVEFYLVDSNGPWRIQFWNGLPNIRTIDLPAKLKKTIPFTISKPFLFGKVSGDPCSNHIEKGFVDVLKSVPSYSAKIVEYNLSRKERKASVAYWLEFFRENKVSRKRFRLFFSKNSSNRDWAETAFWIVPSS